MYYFAILLNDLLLICFLRSVLLTVACLAMHFMVASRHSESSFKTDNGKKYFKSAVFMHIRCLQVDIEL